MGKIIIAPQNYVKNEDETSIFLAGGITDCEDWQSTVIKYIEDIRDLVIYNPRRAFFNTANALDTVKQIHWEFENLEQMDFFTIYFAESESVQPITLYELGRNLVRMKERFPDTWKYRILIGIAEGYKRKDDVILQSMLATGEKLYKTECSATKYASEVRSLLLSFPLKK